MLFGLFFQAQGLEDQWSLIRLAGMRATRFTRFPDCTKMGQVKQSAKIESRHNPRFKLWREWVRHPETEACPWLAVESWKTAIELAESRPVLALLCSDPSDPRASALSAKSRETHSVDARLLRQLSSVESFQGLVAFFEKPSWAWEDLPSTILCPWRLQDPGNLGTLLRTAHATGGGVVCGPGSVSCFNPKVVRASAAALFSTPFRERVAVEDVQSRGWRLVAATPGEGESLFETDLHPPLAFLVGNEGGGLPTEILERADTRVHIPMRAGSESLNAAVAGSLLLYEVYRRGPGRGREAATARATGPDLLESRQSEVT